MVIERGREPYETKGVWRGFFAQVQAFAAAAEHHDCWRSRPSGLFQRTLGRHLSSSSFLPPFFSNSNTTKTKQNKTKDQSRVTSSLSLSLFQSFSHYIIEFSFLAALKRIGVKGVEVRKPEHLEHVSALIIPGGESTTMAKLAEYHNLVRFLS